MSYSATSVNAVQLTVLTSEWRASWMTVCPFDWLTGWPSKWKVSRLASDRQFNWLICWPTNRWPTPSWLADVTAVGGRPEREVGCWCVGRRLMQNGSCCWRQQERKWRGGEETDTKKKNAVMQKQLLNVCVFVWDPGILRRQTAIITSGCQHDTMSRRVECQKAQVDFVPVPLHIPLFINSTLDRTHVCVCELS